MLRLGDFLPQLPLKKIPNHAFQSDNLHQVAIFFCKKGVCYFVGINGFVARKNPVKSIDSRGFVLLTIFRFSVSLL